MDITKAVLEKIKFEWIEFRDDLKRHEYEEAFVPLKLAYDLVSQHKLTLNYASNYVMQMTISDMIINTRVNEELTLTIFEGQTVYALFEDFVYIFFNTGAGRFDIAGELLNKSWDIRREKQRLSLQLFKDEDYTLFNPNSNWVHQ